MFFVQALNLLNSTKPSDKQNSFLLDNKLDTCAITIHRERAKQN